MLRSLLVPLDGSLLAERSLIVVRRILDQHLAFGDPPPRVVLLRVAEASDAKQARIELERSRVALGADAEMRVVAGEPAAAILDAARAEDFSLVIMASHGRDGLDRWLRGNTAERVLRECPAPLLVANPWAIERAAARGGPLIDRILVPLDGSRRAAAVLPAVGALARDLGCEVLLLHVLAADATDSADAAEYLDSCRAKLAGVRVETRVKRGRPAATIIEAVRSANADLIALATHGKTGDEAWFYGSVAERVLHESACPLLVVRTGSFRESHPTDERPAADKASGREAVRS